MPGRFNYTQDLWSYSFDYATVDTLVKNQYNTYIVQQKATMEYLVKSRSEKTKKFINAILPSMIRQLGLERSRKFLLIDVCRLEHDKGLTTSLAGLDSYVIALHPAKWQEMGITLAHEMVHVKQLARGTLKADGGDKWWRGKKYSKRTKYLDMPWEIDAFARQELIFRRSLEE